LPQVYAVNYPLAYFAERIAGESVKVVFPVPADVDPAFWSPDAETVADYQRADLVLLNGAGYAGWLQRATLSQSRLVDTSVALADLLIAVDDTVTHSHGPGGDHSHQGSAFTTWLDMDFAISQARAVFDALVRLHPEDEPDYRERLQELEKDLRELDTRLKVVADRIGDQPLLFSHPVYQYLARTYELNGRSVHWEPDETPGDDQWRELFELLSARNSAWMIWEDEPLPDTASRLEGMGIHSLVFRPCGNRPAGGNLVSVMQDNVLALERAFPASASVESF
jgi:zinc transport system substrate-binding protein